MQEKPVFFNVNSEKLFGIITSATKDQKPTVLLLSGGLQGHNHKKYLTQYLAENNISSFNFDFSGQGKSTGKLPESSLKRKVEEAIAAFQYLDQEAPITIIGTSMGAHISMKLLKKFNIANIILFCPAAYSRKAYDVNFGNGFSEIIRQPDSWKDTDVFEILNDFTGNFLLITGEKDEIVPPEITKSYYEAVQKAKKKEIKTIKEAPHKIHDWLIKNPSEWEKLKPLLIDYMT